MINLLPSPSLGHLSPFQRLFNKAPDYSFLKVFGCKCFPLLRPYNTHKLQFRSLPHLFLGYSPSHHAYKCYNLNSNKMIIARHVRFDENCFPCQTTSSTHSPISSSSNSLSTPIIIPAYFPISNSVSSSQCLDNHSPSNLVSSIPSSVQCGCPESDLSKVHNISSNTANISSLPSNYSI